MGEKISFIDLFGTELELEDEYAREQLSNESAARAEDVAVLEARMDTFIALPAGSTSGDAELQDIRVGADGTTYANAGDAVRGQAVRTKVSFETRQGYIDAYGKHVPDSETQFERYTNKLPCFPGDIVSAKFEWNTTGINPKWVAIAFFDKSGRFISRSNALYNGTAEIYDTAITIPEQVYYYAFTYRSYGNCNVSIFYNSPINTIKNRIEKGLIRGNLNGEFDYGRHDVAVNEGQSVIAAGFRVISDFIEIPPNKKISFYKKDTFTDTIVASILEFDENKNILIASSNYTITAENGLTLTARTSGAKYVRAVFDGEGAPNTATGSPTIDIIKNNITIITEQNMPLSPIIGGEGFYPKFNTAEKTLTMPSDCIFIKDDLGIPENAATTNAGVVIDLTSVRSTAKKIYYNFETNEYVVKPYDTLVNPKTHILICLIRLDLYNYPNSIAINSPYTLDGKLYGIDTTATVDFDAIAWAFNENVKGINHRGFYTAPENTLPAYKLSKKQGFKYAECDVSMTEDRVPVLLHDDTINRTGRNADGTEISETICIGSITYAEALEYDFGIYKSSEYAGTPIPTFKQFIVLCRNLSLHPYIELKSGGGYTETEIQALVDIVKLNGMEGKVTWISFSSTLLQYVKNYDSSARLGFVVGTITAENITTASSLKTTDNEVFLDCSSLPSELIDDCIAADLPVEVWTVNSTSGITNLDPYITGVTSDNLIASKVLYEANKD